MTDQSGMAPAGRDPRKTERLLEAAAGEFARVGFDRANLDTIARIAGVAKGTVYLYFASKSALFTAVLAELRRRLEEALAGSGAREEPAETLRSFVRAHLLVADSTPDLFRCYTSALFGVNREFQAAALSIFTWETDLLTRLLAPMHGGASHRRARARATLLTGCILSSALIRGLGGRDGRSTALEEQALLAMVKRR